MIGDDGPIAPWFRKNIAGNVMVVYTAKEADTLAKARDRIHAAQVADEAIGRMIAEVMNT